MSVRYDERAAAHTADRDAEIRRSLRISRLRLATALAAVACFIWNVERGASTPVSVLAGLLLFAFAVLVIWHARVEERVAWFDAMRVVNLRALARTRRDWNGLPATDAPSGIDLSHHPYALDLDLFGRASLAHWLGPSATPSGAATLASWLLEPAAVEEIRARQAAVADLVPATNWLEQLSAHGILAAGARSADMDRFLAWAEGPALFESREAIWRSVIVTLTLAIWILLASQITGIVDAALWMYPLILGLILSFTTARRLHRTFERAGAGQRALARYAAIFQHAVAMPTGDLRLRELRDGLTVEGHSAPKCMRQLNRILGFAELRTGAAILHFPIQALTLWDFHVAFALGRWQRHVGRRVRAWMNALAELDALSTFATMSADNPSWCSPAFSDAPILVAHDLGHPLLADERRVVNDVEVGPPGTVLVVTGSNMSGKSTLLRAVGLNVVLAQAGAVVCARALRVPASDLQVSIRVQDSLELGLSYFMAALARLKGIVDAAERRREGRVVLYLLDEILQGTNSMERSIAVRGIIRHLLDAGAIGAMTTHDLGLIEEPPLDRAGRLVHFTESVDEAGSMSFDYRVRPGPATSRNALRLMQLIGLGGQVP